MTNRRECYLQTAWEMETGQKTLGDQDKPYPDSGDDSHLSHGDGIIDAIETDSSTANSSTMDSSANNSATNLEETSDQVKMVQEAFQNVSLVTNHGSDR